jgi:AcrR family transcriptional regulator
VSCWISATAVERDAGRIATDQPELWREVRRFNLPVKLALAAAHRVIGALAEPRRARLVALAPCRPGSPELRAISRELDAGFARGSCDRLRVNPIYTLHAIDNLALSALSIRLDNREPSVCLGGAAGQAFAALDLALEQATDELATGGDPPGASWLDAARELVIFGGDQSDASWRGERSEPGDAEACGVAIVVTARPARVRLVAVERSPLGPPVRPAGEPRRPGGEAPIAHAVRGLAGWLAALAAAPAGVHRHAVPARDGDGIDHIEIVTEVA